MGHFRLCKHDYVLSGGSTNPSRTLLQSPGVSMSECWPHLTQLYTSTQLTSEHPNRKYSLSWVEIFSKFSIFCTDCRRVEGNVMVSADCNTAPPKTVGDTEPDQEGGRQKHCTITLMLDCSLNLTRRDKLQLFHSFYILLIVKMVPAI